LMAMAIIKYYIMWPK